MARPRAPIHGLCACLRGAPPDGVDWMSVIGLANQTLTTPALKDAVEQSPARVPDDVTGYINDMFARNLVRNDRLSAQLSEALAALNEEGITPVLVKGAAMLTTLPRERMARRLVSDLDILVSPQDAARALDRLTRLDYRAYFQAPAGAPRWYADLERPGDAGMIDLQQDLPGHGLFYSAVGDSKQHFMLQSWNGRTAYIPSPTYHAFMLILHDQFQDADYWVGRTDLRHLLDLREIVNAPEGIDWTRLASFASGKLARNAIETQAVALFALLGVTVPAEMRSRLVPRLQHRRRMLQIRWPALGPALLTTALLDYGNYRAEFAPRKNVVNERARTLPRLDTARFLFDLARTQSPGKI